MFYLNRRKKKEKENTQEKSDHEMENIIQAKLKIFVFNNEIFIYDIRIEYPWLFFTRDTLLFTI